MQKNREIVKTEEQYFLITQILKHDQIECQ